MSDTAAQPPADQFSAPGTQPDQNALAGVPTAPAPANPFEPAAPAAAAAAAQPEAPPAGPALAAGTLVAYQWDDPYEGKPRVRAGIVVSAIGATEHQGPQAVVAWLADDTSILPTSDVIVVENRSAPTTTSPPAGS